MFSYQHHHITILSVLVPYLFHCEEINLVLCQGQTKTIYCPNNSSINIISAIYGYNGSNTAARKLCDDGISLNDLIPWRDNDDKQCHEPKSTDILAKLCNGRSECEVVASNDVYGNPCKGVAEYLELIYICDKVTDRYDIDVASGKTGDKGDNAKYEENDDDNDNGEEVENGLTSPVAIYVTVPVIFIIIAVIFTICLAYFLRNKRTAKSKQNSGNTLKCTYVTGSVNLEYEIVGSRRHNPTTDSSIRMNDYESFIHVDSNNLEYAYAGDTGPVVWSEAKGAYLIVM